MQQAYEASIQNRRQVEAERFSLGLGDYLTLGDFGLNGDWVSPIQITSRSPTGPVLIAQDWLDGERIAANVERIRETGWLNGMQFNNVLNAALAMAELNRSQVYITQVFHLIRRNSTAAIAKDHYRISFERVTAGEVRGRKVIALGSLLAAFAGRMRLPAKLCLIRAPEGFP